MIRILKHFKPYLGSILLVILLLFIQANADLSLPDYMSRIVNVGIQQEGIDGEAPVALRPGTLERMILFMDGDEAAAVRRSYRLALPADPDYAALARRYPGLGGSALLVLDPPGGSPGLSAAMKPALAALSALAMAPSGPDRAAAMGGAPEGGPDPTRPAPGTGPADAPDSLPPAARASMAAAVRAGVDGLDPMVAERMAIAAVKAEYLAMGLDLRAAQSSYIMSMGGRMLLLTLLSVAATVLAGLLGARAAAGVARDLRRGVFAKVEGLSPAELDRFSTASLITRSTNDVTQVQMATLMGLRMLFYAPIIGIGGVIKATATASSMWWIIAVAVGVLVAIIAAVFAVALPRFKRIQEYVDRLNLVVRENLSGMMVIRAFNSQDRESARFEKANGDLTGTTLFVTRVMVVMMPLMMLILNLVSLLILWTGAHEVAASQIRVGDMMAFMQYAMQIFFAFIMMSMMFIMLPRASVSAERIAEVLAAEPSIVDPESPRRFPAGARGTVEFRDLSFRYPGSSEDVLHRISFTAEPGSTTAIIGTTGAGKSTLVSLVLRFHDPSSGSVLMDGIDLRELGQEELRRRIGYVPQKASLFSGTVASNLRWADASATDEELALALDTAQASEFVDAWPEGTGAAISQGGANVSGGQRQRLAIARALARKASVYLFDDSFSALDYRTDLRLRQALRERLGDATVIMVTQRVATIKQADRIVVLDEGRMVGMGTHRELMEGCEVYRDIALSQLRQEELA